MIVVFDTCTKPEYYEDVHKVLAAPRGTIVRYDYERRLFTEDAANQIEALEEGGELPTLLMYGQFKNYSRGDPDRTFMLTWDNGMFVPTRCAKIVNRAVASHAERHRDNIFFHLELEDFLDPHCDQIEALVTALERRRELPFDRERAYKWVADCPAEIDSERLQEGDEANWHKVVDQLASPPSQFSGDVFWRVTQVSNDTGKNAESLAPVPRKTNRFGDTETWHKDYVLTDDHEYLIVLRSYIPNSEEAEMPQASVSIKEDTSKLLKLPDEKVAIRRNATNNFKVGVSPISFIRARYARIALRTLTGQDDRAYSPGSVAELTVALEKNKVKLAFSFVTALLSFVLIVIGGVVARSDSLVIGVPLIMLGAVSAWATHWLLTGRLKLPS